MVVLLQPIVQEYKNNILRVFSHSDTASYRADTVDGTVNGIFWCPVKRKKSEVTSVVLLHQAAN